MKRVLVSAVVALAVVLGTGCASISSRSGAIPGSGQRGEKYPGVKVDLGVIKGSATSMTDARSLPVMLIILPVGLIDLPLSFCIDTIMLPVDALTGNIAEE